MLRLFQMPPQKSLIAELLEKQAEMDGGEEDATPNRKNSSYLVADLQPDVSSSDSYSEQYKHEADSVNQIRVLFQPPILYCRPIVVNELFSETANLH